MQSAGLSVVPYHTYVPTMSDWGWILGMRKKEGENLKSRVQTLDFENIETQFLNTEVMGGMLSFGKGMFEDIDNIAISTELEPKVDQYYRESEWGW